MNNNLKDIQYINLPQDRKAGDITIKSSIPLPVQMLGNQSPSEIQMSSIVAGLIKVLAWDNENPNLGYYRTLLLALQPDAVKELNLASIAKSDKKDYPFAEELMLAVNHISHEPESYVNLAVLYAKMAVEYHKKGKETTADLYDDKILQILMQCLEDHPGYGPVLSEIAAFHLRHGDKEEAKDYLEKYASTIKDKAERDKVLATIKKISSDLEDDDRILYAYDQLMMGEPEKAIEVLDKFVSKIPNKWEAFFLRGWAKRLLNSFEEAEKDLLESIKIDPNNAEVYNELSLCSKEKGNNELAKSYLQIATDLDEENVIYLTNLAFVYLADKEFDLAREMLEKARILDAEDPEVKYLIQEYETLTGEKIGELITETILSKEEMEILEEKAHKEHHHHEEI